MSQPSGSPEGRRSVIGSGLIAPLYAVRRAGSFRSMLRRLALRFEGGAMYSLTVRELYRRHHDLEVGLYTIGPCEAGPAGLDPGTSIGRYCSIYYTVRTITLDEAADDGRGPVLAFGSAVNGAGAPAVARHELQIGNDVFIGHNSIILPSTGSIGDGAFIGAARTSLRGGYGQSCARRALPLFRKQDPGVAGFPMVAEERTGTTRGDG
jgi:virginiamycin A acetyltransferase